MRMDSGAVTRQRGRPRLEARDQTAGDVREGLRNRVILLAY